MWLDYCWNVLIRALLQESGALADTGDAAAMQVDPPLTATQVTATRIHCSNCPRQVRQELLTAADEALLTPGREGDIPATCRASLGDWHGGANVLCASFDPLDPVRDSSRSLRHALSRRPSTLWADASQWVRVSGPANTHADRRCSPQGAWTRRFGWRAGPSRPPASCRRPACSRRR